MACNAPALENAIKGYYSDHQIDVNHLVLLTSDGASVITHFWINFEKVFVKNMNENFWSVRPATTFGE